MYKYLISSELKKYKEINGSTCNSDSPYKVLKYINQKYRSERNGTTELKYSLFELNTAYWKGKIKIKAIENL